MTNFCIFFVFLIIFNSLYSLKDWKIFQFPYKNLRFYRFERVFNMKIANNGTKNEFIVFSDYNFKVDYNTYLQFDIWTLLDFHKLYWILKFRNKAKDLDLI